jgi:putative oxidoreductase
MRRLLNLFDWLEQRKEYGIFWIRLTIGVRLMLGTADNVFSWAHMIEFRDFLEKHGTPFPLFSAHLSAYAQFICGLLFVLGLAFRPAAIAMIINFICALLIAHRTGGYLPASAAIIILFVSLGFLIHGPGKPALDEWIARRRQ